MPSPHTPSQSTSSSSQPPVPISITICGDGGCGKSSITLRLVRSQWTSEYDPTIEDSYSITRRIDGVTYHLSLTDTAGQEEYRGMWATSNLGADAFLLVYDITSRDSLDALEYFNELIDMESETRHENAARARRAGVNPLDGSRSPGALSGGGGGGGMGGRGGAGGGGGGVDVRGGAGSGARTVAPVKIVAGNKCDLQESRQVPAAVGLDWARRRGCGFMETSARLEVNIEETFALIVRRVVEARRLAELGVLGPSGAGGGDGVINTAGDTGDRRGATKPLTPLPSGGDGAEDEKAAHGRGPGMRGPNIMGGKIGRGHGGLWKKLRCW